MSFRGATNTQINTLFCCTLTIKSHDNEPILTAVFEPVEI